MLAIKVARETGWRLWCAIYCVVLILAVAAFLMAHTVALAATQVRLDLPCLVSEFDDGYGPPSTLSSRVGYFIPRSGLWTIKDPPCSALYEGGLEICNGTSAAIFDVLFTLESGYDYSRGGGPTNLDRKPGAVSGTLLGSSSYAARCWGCTPKYTISGVRPSSAECGRPEL